ncbi:MAG: PIN domain-containing protein [Tagaea sp.]
MRTALDANVLVYAYDSDAPGMNDRAAALVEELARSGTAIVALQALAETANVMRRKKVALSVVRARLDRLRGLFPVVHAQDSDLDDALWAVERHKLAFWDAMLWATCRRAGCTVLFTEDFQDGRMLKGLRFVDPFLAKNAKYLPKA